LSGSGNSITWSRALPALLGSRYWIQATATCNGGLKSSTTYVRFTINSTPPTVTITAPNANYAAYTSLSQATGTASDSVGINRVTVRLYRYNNATATAGYWNGTGWTSTASAANNIAATLNGSGPNITWSLNLPALTVGRYWLQATAINLSGLKTLTGNLNFAITGSATVTLSSAAAAVSTRTVKLNFAGALDVASATELTHYALLVNGVPVTPESLNYVWSTVSLVLPVGAMASGDRVEVHWHDLLDSQGNIVNGQTTITAK
jgi:hypothetical protein